MGEGREACTEGGEEQEQEQAAQVRKKQRMRKARKARKQQRQLAPADEGERIDLVVDEAQNAMEAGNAEPEVEEAAGDERLEVKEVENEEMQKAGVEKQEEAS